MVSPHLHRRLSECASDEHRRHGSAKQLGVHAGVSIFDSRVECGDWHRVEDSRANRCNYLWLCVHLGCIQVVAASTNRIAIALGNRADLFFDGVADSAGGLCRVAMALADRFVALLLYATPRCVARYFACGAFGYSTGLARIRSDVRAAFRLSSRARAQARRRV